MIARPFIGEPGNYERTPNRHDFSLEPRRPNYLTQVRGAGAEVHGVGKIPDIFAHLDMDHEHPTKSNVEGITVTEQLLRDIDSASCSRTSWRRTCSGATATTRELPLSSRTSTAASPTCSKRCAVSLLIITSDHGIDPTTASTDHSREYGLLLAYAQGKNAAGMAHEGEFGDVGATVNAWLGGKAAPGGSPARRYSSREAEAQRSGPRAGRVRGRVAIQRAAGDVGLATGRDAQGMVVEALAAIAAQRVLEVGRRGGLAEQIARSWAPRWSRSTSRSAWSS